jgi:hypothetical protein
MKTRVSQVPGDFVCEGEPASARPGTWCMVQSISGTRSCAVMQLLKSLLMRITVPIGQWRR